MGTSFAIWPGEKLVGVKGKDMKAAGCCVYGPRTTLTIAIDGVPGVREFLLTPNGQWVKTNSVSKISEGLSYSPGNMRSRYENPGWKKLTDYWIEEEYKLRYTGGMVPDVNQIIVKEQGVFAYVSSPSHPSRLTLLYEVAPLAFLIERAGGATSDGTKSILENEIIGTKQSI